MSDEVVTPQETPEAPATPELTDVERGLAAIDAVKAQMETVPEPVVEEPPEAPQTEEAGPSLLELMEVNRAQREKDAQLKADTARLEQERQELESLRNFKQQALKNPLEALKALGLDGESAQEWVKYALFQQFPDKAPADMKARMADLRSQSQLDEKLSELEQWKKSQEEQFQQVQAQQEIASYQRELVDTVKTLPEDGIRRYFKSHDELAQYVYNSAVQIAQHNEQHGTQYDVSVAGVLKSVENHLEKERQRFVPQESAPPAKDRAATPTLSNKLSQKQVAPTPKASSELTEDEWIARGLQAMEAARLDE